MISNNIQKQRIIRERLQDLLQESVVADLNIYNLVHLELTAPLLAVSVAHNQTSFEKGVSFNLEGELSGKVICLIDTFNKNISAKEEKLFQSLFTESMNILIGKILTNLEAKTDIMATITTPTSLIDTHLLKLNKISKFDKLMMSMGYKMLSNNSEFNCRIIFISNKNKFNEVPQC